jgi:tetratricopeptide (TPR) repeat protein
LSSLAEATGHFFAGRIERGVEILADRADVLPPGPGRTACAAGLVYYLSMIGRADEAISIAEETLPAARVHGNPMWIAVTLHGYATVFLDREPLRALRAYRENLEYSREQQLGVMNIMNLGWSAWLEALHGDLAEALELFDAAFDLLHRSGSHPTLAETLARLAVCFDHAGQPQIAATLHGASTRFYGAPVPGVPDVAAGLRRVLGAPVFEASVAAGAAMDFGDAVAYARRQIHLALQSMDPR